MTSSENTGIIGQTVEHGFPVIYRLVDELPTEAVRNRFPWLTAVSWRFDPAIRNGMPAAPINEQMITLERAIDAIEAADLCRHAYSRTGNGLKELVYYIVDRERFMKALNDAIRDHPPYPIEIEFYEDPQWSDLQKIRELFNKE